MRGGFITASVVRGVRRNVSMTIALVLSTAITMAFVGAALLAQKEISRFRANYAGKLFVSVYLCTHANKDTGHCVTRPVLGTNGKPKIVDGIPVTDSRTTESQRTAIASALARDPMVVSYTYVTETDQLNLARKVLTKNTTRGLQVGDLAASFTVNLKNIKRDFVPFAQRYSVMPGVSDTTTTDKVIKRLLDIIDGVRLLSVLVAFVVLVASILLIANTLQVAAAQRRNETSIMRLVGASRWMTELPFLLEAVFAAVIGGVIAAGMVWLAKAFVLNNIFAEQVDSGVFPNLSGNDIFIATGISLLGGVVVAAITAFATLRLYVKL